MSNNDNYNIEYYMNLFRDNIPNIEEYITRYKNSCELLNNEISNETNMDDLYDAFDLINGLESNTIDSKYHVLITNRSNCLKDMIDCFLNIVPEQDKLFFETKLTNSFKIGQTCKL